jgi:hypothetical protein
MPPCCFADDAHLTVVADIATVDGELAAVARNHPVLGVAHRPRIAAVGKSPDQQSLHPAVGCGATLGDDTAVAVVDGDAFDERVRGGAADDKAVEGRQALNGDLGAIVGRSATALRRDHYQVPAVPPLVSPRFTSA